MQKVYERINWENDPSTNTPINEDNLNKMDYALDKIDDRVVNLSGYEARVTESEKNAKQSEINAKVSEENSKQSELKAKQYMEQAFSGTPEGYAALVEQVGRIDIAKSTDYTLPNSKKGGYRLQKLLGNTEQKKLSGKQLFNAYGTQRTTYGTATVSENGAKISATGTYYVEFPIELVANTSYIVSCDVESFTTSKQIDFTYEDDTLEQFSLRTSENSLHANFTPTQNVKAISLYCGVGTNGTTVYRNVMVRLASVTDDTWEEYCGGVPSPNPNYPQSLNHTFDVVEMIQGYYHQNNGNFSNSIYAVTNKHKIPCKSGDIIKIETDSKMTTLSTIYYNSSGLVSYCNSYEATIHEATVPSGVEYFHIDIINGNAEITPDTVGKITLTINGKYVGCVKGHGKNLFNAYGTQGTSYGSAIVSENGAKISVNGTYYVSIPIELESNTPYIVSWGVESYTATKNVNFRYEDGTLQTFQMTASQNSLYAEFTPTKNVSAIYLHCGIGTSGTTVYTDVMVRKADIADNTYEPYQETVAYYYTEQPTRLGDFLFKDSDGLFKVEHNVAEITLNGSEVIQTPSTNRFDVIISGVKYGSAEEPNAISTHYIGKYEISNGSIFSSGVKSALSIVDERFSTVEDFVAWLAESQPKVQYKLATPIIEVLDTESQINLNKLETFDTVTYIEVDSRVQPLGIEGEYGTSQVGAYTLLALNENDIDKVERAEMKAQTETLRNMILSLGGNA